MGAALVRLGLVVALIGLVAAPRAEAAAVTHGVLASDTSACDGSPDTITTGSFTPAANDLLVALVGNSGSVDDGAVTDSLGGTWTKITSFTKAAGADTGYLFVRTTLVASSSMTVTFDTTGDSGLGCFVFVLRVSGMTKTGADAVTNHAVSSNQSAGGTPAITLPSAATTTNPTVCFLFNQTNPATVDPPSGWTEDATNGETGHATPTTGGEWCYRDSGFTGTTITWGSTSASQFGALGFELDASAAAGGPHAGSLLMGMVGK